MGSPPPPKRPKAVPSPPDSPGRGTTPKRDIERDVTARRPTVDGGQAKAGTLDGATRPYPRASTNTPVTRSPAIKPPKGPPPPPPPRRIAPPPKIDVKARSSGPAAPKLTGDAATSGAARPIVDDWDFDPIEDAPTIARNSSTAVAELQAEADALAAARAKAAESKASGDESRATASTAGVLGSPAAPSTEADTATADESTGDSAAPEESAPPEGDETDDAQAEPQAPPAPRLPMPGMLRDGSPRPRTDFRAPPRAPLPTVAASAPPPGVAPPKKVDDGDADRHLRPGDTGAFIAVVANELMAELANDEPAAGESVELEAIADMSDVAAAASASAIAVVPSAVGDAGEAAQPPVDPPTRRKAFPWIPAAIAVVLLLGLLVWLMGDSTPDDTSAPGESVAQAAAPSADGTPVAAAADDGSTGGAATAPPGDSTDEGSTGGTTQAGTGTDTGSSDGSGSGSGSGSDSGDTTGGSETGEGSSDDGLVIEDETDSGEPAPSPVAATHSKPKHKPSGKPSKPASHKSGKSKPASTPSPKSTEDPAELLKRARIAYRTGKGAGAYRLASRARKLQPSTAAAELMALASCLMKKPDQARTALKAVPLLRRSSIRSECRSKHGVRVGV